MPVPTRSEALALLMATSPSARLVLHVTVAAEIAAFLAHRLAGGGESVDRRLVETAALLHDVDKALPPEDPLRALGHGHAGAEHLARAGHPELMRAVAAHPVMRLAEPDAEEWLTTAPLEQRIVAYADKRATQRVVSLDQRFARWYRRYPEHSDRLALAHSRSRQLEAAICAAAGIPPTAVERLRWVAEALVRATSAGLLPSSAPQTLRDTHAAGLSMTSARPSSR